MRNAERERQTIEGGDSAMKTDHREMRHHRLNVESHRYNRVFGSAQSSRSSATRAVPSFCGRDGHGRVGIDEVVLGRGASERHGGAQAVGRLTKANGRSEQAPFFIASAAKRAATAATLTDGVPA